MNYNMSPITLCLLSRFPSLSWFKNGFSDFAKILSAAYRVAHQNVAKHLNTDEKYTPYTAHLGV